MPSQAKEKLKFQKNNQKLAEVHWSQPVTAEMFKKRIKYSIPNLLSPNKLDRKFQGICNDSRQIKQVSEQEEDKISRNSNHLESEKDEYLRWQNEKLRNNLELHECKTNLIGNIKSDKFLEDENTKKISSLYEITSQLNNEKFLLLNANNQISSQLQLMEQSNKNLQQQLYDLQWKLDESQKQLLVERKKTEQELLVQTTSYSEICQAYNKEKDGHRSTLTSLEETSKDLLENKKKVKELEKVVGRIKDSQKNKEKEITDLQDKLKTIENSEFLMTKETFLKKETELLIQMKTREECFMKEIKELQEKLLSQSGIFTEKINKMRQEQNKKEERYMKEQSILEDKIRNFYKKYGLARD